MRTPHLFRCPDCNQPLRESTRSYACRSGHHFDRARSGYVNLHRSRRRGDTRTMLRARRSFLERGFFQPISDAVNASVADHLQHLRAAGCLSGHELVVDVGCGEGYYLARLAGHLQQHITLPTIRFVGLDASKEAARLTALRLRGHACAVADVHDGLYLRRGGAVALLNAFAPRNAQAFAEALAPRGLCLIVIPRPEHFKELREQLRLLEIPRAKGARVIEQFRGRLRLVGVQDLTYPVTLDEAAADAWVRMGPNALHVDADRLRIVPELGPIQTRVACTLFSFRR